jgi:hypothetical protein
MILPLRQNTVFNDSNTINNTNENSGTKGRRVHE